MPEPPAVHRDGDAWVLRAPSPRGASLRVEAPAERPWDWSRAAAIVWELRAATNGRLRVAIGHGAGAWVFHVVPKPGLRLRVAVPVADLRERPPNTPRPGHFTFGGGPHPVDLSAVRAVTFTYDQDGPPAELWLRGPFAEPAPVAPAVLDPRPVVDELGQWTGAGGAPRTEAEVRAAWAAEDAERARGGAPPGRSRWGGDARRRLEATGRFRVQRAEGRWTLLDPDGHPFFSVGPNVVVPHSQGPTRGQEALYADLAAARRGLTEPDAADFYAANLRRRHGADWTATFAAATRMRLSHWGFNTIANWSDQRLAAGGPVPWVCRLHGVDAWCHRLPDVFDPAFARLAAETVRAQVLAHRGDAALIGYFVGNEPVWTFPGAVHPLQTVFGGVHPHTAAAAIDWLRARYAGDLAALGRAWGRDYGSWEAVAGEGPPDVRRGSATLRADAAEFAGLLLERLFGAICAAVRDLDPERLMLGARFYSAGMAEPLLRACRVFDVVSYNGYGEAPDAAAIDRLASVAERPVLIGEFHFGVCGRGMSGALVTVRDDAARGEAYAAYVRAAACHPACVGAHWFQWVDEPVTGRFDGEDYNIGLVDVTDVPYSGLVAGAMRAHRELYRWAAGEGGADVGAPAR